MIGKPLQIITYLYSQDKDKQFEIKEHKKKRTRNQNSYYWELLNQLSKKLRIAPEELHFELIKKSCPFSEFLVPDEADLRAIEYYEERGKLKKNDKLYKIIRVYVGSSKLDTTEMGILLDNLIEECKLQGIETMTPEELAKMRALENLKGNKE
jgi:hypothetical protein